MLKRDSFLKTVEQRLESQGLWEGLVAKKQIPLVKDPVYNRHEPFLTITKELVDDPVERSTPQKTKY